jgi:hypothetical protein
MVCPMTTSMQYWTSWITLFLMGQVPYYCYVVMSKMTWRTQALQLQVVKICHSFCTNPKLSNISTTIFNNNSKTRCCREGCWNSKSSLAPSPLLSPPLFTGQSYIPILHLMLWYFFHLLCFYKFKIKVSTYICLIILTNPLFKLNNLKFFNNWVWVRSNKWAWEDFATTNWK